MKRLVVNTLQNPPAGSDWSLTPSNSEWSCILNITAQLDTSATVANRTLSIELLDADDNDIFQEISAFNQPASNNITYQLSSIVPSSINNNGSIAGLVTLPIRPFWMPPRWRFRSITYQIEAGDQWSNIVATYYTTETQEETLAIAEALGISDT